MINVVPPKISIIIPVYNAEKYLRQCLDSVVNQTLKEIEILCINDGSTDSSLDILNEYAEQDKRIKVFSQKNSGPATARNVGLDNATGDYLWFIDADDWCELNACEYLYQYVQKKQVDIVFFAANSFVEKYANENRNRKHFWDLSIYGMHDVDTSFNTLNKIELLMKSPLELWNHLYKTETVKKYELRFTDELFMGDDILFNISLYLTNVKIAIYQTAFYNYRIGNGSTIVDNLKKKNSKCSDYSIRLAQHVDNLIKKYDIVPLYYKYIVSNNLNRIFAHLSYVYYPQKLYKQARQYFLNIYPNIYDKKFLKSIGHFKSVKRTIKYNYWQNKFFSFLYQKTQKEIKIFNVPVFRKKTQSNKTKYYVLGIRIYKKKNIIKNNNSPKISPISVIRSSYLHSKTFPQFKNIHQGKDIVIVGTGETLKNYTPIKNAIHIGLNRAFLCDKIKFDYLFVQDFFSIRNYIDEFSNYKCSKFIGRYLTEIWWSIPENFFTKQEKCFQYYSAFPSEEIYTDIECMPLMDFNSISFPALHFALYTHPRRIYLVGCDTNNGKYFNNEKYLGIMSVDKMIRGYLKLKDFIFRHYPDTEIISINPVGLKGFFKDIYTNKEPEKSDD